MPTNVVDFSALSEIIHDEPWQLHVWELTPAEYVEQMKNPRKFEKMGVELPENCPIMTEMLNHDFSPRILPMFGRPTLRRSKCATWAAAILASPRTGSPPTRISSPTSAPSEKKVPGT
jgi:hypothetical protein